MKRDCILVSWLFLLAGEKSQQRESLDSNDFESDAGNITLSVTLSTETSDQDFVVFSDIVQATIPWNESCDFLAVFLQEHSAALSDGRVRLLSLDTELLDDDTLSVGGSQERVLVSRAQESLVKIFVSPTNGIIKDKRLALSADYI